MENILFFTISIFDKYIGLSKIKVVFKKLTHLNENQKFFSIANYLKIKLSNRYNR